MFVSQVVLVVGKVISFVRVKLDYFSFAFATIKQLAKDSQPESGAFALRLGKWGCYSF